jgi:hypothetical protein
MFFKLISSIKIIRQAQNSRSSSSIKGIGTSLPASHVSKVFLLSLSKSLINGE